MSAWATANKLATAVIIALIALLALGGVYLYKVRQQEVQVAAGLPAPAEEASAIDLEPLESELEDQGEAIGKMTEAVEAQTEAISSLVEAMAAEPAAPTPKPEEPTNTPEPQEPTPTPEAVEPEGTVETGEEEVEGPVWSDPDAFDARDSEYPFGDAQAWTYVQTWDGKNLDTVLHVAVAPGVILVVRDYIGTRFQVWNGPDLARWEEMRNECKVRDQLPKTPALIIIESTTDADIQLLPSKWSVLPFPG